jgi:predicted metal-dependent enzyme (double-stranded beta helix superfamily)
MIETATPTTSASLRELIASIRGVVQSTEGAREIGTAVAEVLPRYLGSDDLLTEEQMEPGIGCYRQHVLHVEPDGSFSVVSLVWLPGQSTAIHDHVSWCVVGVHKGEEHETVYQRDGGEADAHLRVTGQTVSRVGSVAALVPPGDIHHVCNGGECMAVSLHIYGADIGKLGSSIRRHYDLDVRQPAAAAV